HALERAQHAGPQGRRRVAQRVDQLIGALVALATLADAAIDDLLQVVAARETAHVAGAEALPGAALPQHADELTDLVHLRARPPLRHHPFEDLARRGEWIHRPGGGAAAIALRADDAEVPELEPRTLADEHVERGEVAMEQLPAMELAEHLEDPRDLGARAA